LALSELSPRPRFEQVWPTVQPIHAACSEIVAKIWKLDPDVCTVLSLHHELAIGGRTHPIAAAVAVADCLAELAGAGFYEDVDTEHLERASKALGLDARGLERLDGEARELAAAIH
jgi:hypothetical protein